MRSLAIGTFSAFAVAYHAAPPSRVIKCDGNEPLWSQPRPYGVRSHLSLPSPMQIRNGLVARLMTPCQFSSITLAFVDVCKSVEHMVV